MNRYQTKQLYTWAGAFCLFVAFFTILCFLAYVAWPFAMTFAFAVVGVGFLWRANQVKPEPKMTRWGVPGEKLTLDDMLARYEDWKKQGKKGV